MLAKHFSPNDDGDLLGRLCCLQTQMNDPLENMTLLGAICDDPSSKAKSGSVLGDQNVWALAAAVEVVVVGIWFCLTYISTLRRSHKALQEQLGRLTEDLEKLTTDHDRDKATHATIENALVESNTTLRQLFAESSRMENHFDHLEPELVVTELRSNFRQLNAESSRSQARLADMEEKIRISDMIDANLIKEIRSSTLAPSVGQQQMRSYLWGFGMFAVASWVEHVFVPLSAYTFNWLSSRHHNRLAVLWVVIVIAILVACIFMAQKIMRPALPGDKESRSPTSEPASEPTSDTSSEVHQDESRSNTDVASPSTTGTQLPSETSRSPTSVGAQEGHSVDSYSNTIYLVEDQDSD